MGGSDFNPFAETEPEAASEALVVEAEEEEEETPPDPKFLIIPNRYGAGTEVVATPDGQPLGLWLRDEHPSLDGAGVEQLLLSIGLDEKRSAWYGGHRDGAIEARAELRASPAMQSLAVAEAQAEDRVSMVRQAFLKRQAEGKGKL